MFRISILFLLFFSFSHAKSIHVDYTIEFGIFGEVAQAKATLVSSKKRYTIEANVTAIGYMAKVISKNLKERHISKGYIKNRLLFSNMYQMIKSYGIYKSTTIYQVDHKKRSVTKHYKRWKKKKKESDAKMRLGYYAPDDLISFFLNLSKHIKEKYQYRKYTFKVTGADRKNGRVDVIIPPKKDLLEMKKLLGGLSEGEWYARVIMYRKLYHSKKGELLVRIGRTGLVEKAVLKDLIFFGDVRIIKQ
jgi:hypothetical protein